ncbi:MAG: flagellar basal body-associated FliL family protein [Lentisphaerae bacterium]|nr:flagellar basal body-associated FliL family protein [Lentisphaerota bacterium]
MAKEKEAPVEEKEEPVEAGEEQAPAAKKPGSKNSMLVMILAGFLVIVLVQVAVVFYVVATKPSTAGEAKGEALKSEKKTESGAKSEKKSEKGEKGEKGEGGKADKDLVYDVEPVLNNIAGTQGTRYIKITAHFVLSEASLKEELKSNSVMIRDRICSVLDTKSIFDLEGPKAKDAIKKEIKDRVNGELKDKMRGTILEVLFSEYLIQ